ncbi:MAG TPA: hypothetical protein VF615_20255 [Longimicrobiaceae bacterium]|jgi:hypothetical protein
MQHGTAATPTGSGAHAGHGAPAGAAPADEATRKLLALAGELVKDPAVQREIQQDAALREAWSDPDVRRVVTTRP